MSGDAAENLGSYDAPTRPTRIQRRRTKGYNMQEHSRSINGRDAVSVCRPGKYGNPHTVGRLCPICGFEHTPAEAVDEFREDIRANEAARRAVRKELHGKNLACFCSLDAPCHGDVLLELAND